jgi:hypothetical protein
MLCLLTAAFTSLPRGRDYHQYQYQRKHAYADKENPAAAIGGLYVLNLTCSLVITYAALALFLAVLFFRSFTDSGPAEYMLRLIGARPAFALAPVLFVVIFPLAGIAVLRMLARA